MEYMNTRCLRKGLWIKRGVLEQGLFHNNFMSLLAISAIGAATGILLACNSAQKNSYSLLNDTPIIKTSVTSHITPKVKLQSRPDLLYAEQFNNALLAELYSRLGKPELSAKYYHKLLIKSDDSDIARRATILAASSGRSKEALEAVRFWVNKMPDSLEAQQYFSLILLRNNAFKESVDQLHQISQLVEREEKRQGEGETKGEEKGNNEGNDDNKGLNFSRGLRFIGSMLSIESHHDKALIVFQDYIKKYGIQKNQIQQLLIISSLAMNAKKYNIVLAALSRIKQKELIRSPKIVLMKVKALQELNKISDAIILLSQLIDKNEASDSDRLQLVRLLILNHQKEEAGPYLKELVRNHPDNNDLLKSLIALEIDQAQLESAKKNLKKLSLSKDYLSDVAYFKGEISEAEGDLKSALKNYQQVVDGNLQKRAQKKILKIGKGLGLRIK